MRKKTKIKKITEEEMEFLKPFLEDIMNKEDKEYEEYKENVSNKLLNIWFENTKPDKE